MIKKHLFKLFTLSLISGILLFPVFAQFNKLPPEKKAEINALIFEGKHYQESSKFNDAIRCYNRAGYLLWTNNCPGEAAENYKKALEIAESTKKTNAIKVISSNLGLIYSDLEDYKISLHYFEKSLQIKRLENNKLEVATELINIAYVLKYLNKIEEANQRLEESLNIAKENHEMTLMKRAYGMLAENYEALGNTEKSFEYYNMFSSLDNYLKQQKIKETEEKTKQQIKEMEGVTKKAMQEKEKTEIVLKNTEKSLKSTSDSLKKVEAITKEQQLQLDLLYKEKQLQELKDKQQKIINFFVYGVAILLGIIAFILFKGYKQKQKSNALLTKQKEEIHKQNINITNSINYAKRIQKAILPSTKNFTHFSTDSFIYFKPRDLVSGDFYWFSDTKLQSVLSKPNQLTLKNSDAGKFIVAAVDCTGHGVPGALMSMISYNLLHNIISSGISKPSEILDNLHYGIITELKQDDKSEVQDGMDIALCLIDKNNKKLQFSGAKNPLIYIQNGKLNRIKGDNQSIGGQIFKEDNRFFTNHEIQLNTPTTVYLFSDGFTDQLGGDSGKKFLYIRFQEILKEIHTKPFPEQKIILDETLKNWTGNRFQQLDDILVIGFKIDI